MNVRQAIFGEIGTRSGPRLSGVDISSLVRRLILFDRVIIKSFRLQEVPHLVRAFGKTGFTTLVDSGLLKFCCEFTSLIVDINRGGVRDVPLNHFTFGIVDAANRDANLRSEFRLLQSVPGLKNAERASLEEAIWRSLVRPPTTYGQDLLAQVESDLRNNTPAIKAAVIERLRSELCIAQIPEGISIEIDEANNRVFHIKNTMSTAFGFSPEKTHLVLQQSVLAVANLNQRLANMQAYSAITGFRDTEAPLLFGKLAGIIAPMNPERVERQFQRVIELANIPDFKSGQRVNVELLLKVRDSPECREFREWLPSLEDASDADIREAVAGLRNRLASLSSSTAGKLIRLVATTGIGLIPVVGPIVGVAAGAIDSFLVEKVLPRSGIVAFLTEAYPSLFVSA